MIGSIEFELLLLSRMSNKYRESVLEEIGISETESARMVQQSGYGIDDVAYSKISTYRKILGPEVNSKYLDKETDPALAGYVAHYFVLRLWPHLYWVVHESDVGSSWEIGFQNQVQLTRASIGPAVVRPGVWTLSALRRLADTHELHDGWDDLIVMRFMFDGVCFEGEFCLGLLQSWRSVEDS